MKSITYYLALLLVMTAVFAYGAALYPHSPYEPVGVSLGRPSKVNYLGTDDLGVDLFAQLSRGFFFSIFVGLTTASLSLVLGGLIGTASAYAGGKMDFVLSFIINQFLSMPQLPVMIVIGAFFGQSIWNVILIISLFSWASIAKIIRARVLQIKDQDYIRAAKSYGGSFFYIFRRHMLHEIGPLLAVCSLGVIGRAIIQEASLAFLGLSDPLSRSWGLLMNRAIYFPGIYFTDYWRWWLLPPLISLIMVLYCIRMITRELELMIHG